MPDMQVKYVPPDVVRSTGEGDGPGGRTTVNVTFSLSGIPKDPRQVRLNIISAAGEMVKVVAHACAVEAANPKEPPSLKWDKMRPAVVNEERRAAIFAAFGQDAADDAGSTFWVNDRYTVTVRDLPARDDRPPMVHLSIRRNDRAACNDWRDFQRIKNDVCGPECEAVQLFPAESRLVDEANQFHLYVLPRGVTFGFGFAERMVGDTDPTGLSKQRPFHPDDRPGDANEKLEAVITKER